MERLHRRISTLVIVPVVLGALLLAAASAPAAAAGASYPVQTQFSPRDRMRRRPAP